MKRETNPVIQADILRYKKNKLPAMLALLGLVFNCLYFCLLYGVKASRDSSGDFTKWVTIEIGISVILTLVVLLVTFLSSEGIKGYNKKYAIPLLVIAVFQIIRIFFYPLYGLNKNLLTVPYFWIYPETSAFEFTMMIIWLCASSASLIASAVLGYIRCIKLEKHLKAIESGELDIDAVLKEIDDQETAPQNEVATEADSNTEVQ